VGLWLRTHWRAFDHIVICRGSQVDRDALDRLIQFTGILAGRRRLLISAHEDDRELDGTGIWTMVRTLARFRSPAGWSAGRAALLQLSVWATAIGLTVFREASPPEPRHRGGRVALLVPILPDLSHTFVYREVLAVKRRHPDVQVIALERGDDSVIHQEAAELLSMTTFQPHPSPNAYLRLYLKQWLIRPRRMAALVRWASSNSATFGPGAVSNDSRVFLRLEHLTHSSHLIRALILADELSRLDIGFVHAYGSTYPALRALVAWQLLGIPYSISTFVDFDYATPFQLLDLKFGAARFVFACSNFCVRRLRDRFPSLRERFDVLHIGLPLDYAAQPAFRPQEGPPRLIFVGRFVPKKGLDTLIAACRILVDRGTDFRCRLYGSGDEEGRLHAQTLALNLSRVVSFEPPIPNERFYSVMCPGDVFVCPSRYASDGERDGIPTTLVEAMAAGVTVVSTSVSGIPELIEDGVNGFIVPPDDPERLAECLLGLLTRPAQAQIAANAIRTVRDAFSLPQTVHVLEDRISRETSFAFGSGSPASDRPGASA